ncbi:MAG: HD domain-containing protein [Clostridia bacterium]|nr:HD domain-containing protein [Clostridia bacterium]
MSKQNFASQIAVGDEVLDFFIAKNPGVRVGSNQKMYFDITLADKSGEINGKKWDVSEAESATLSAIAEGDVVKIKASVTEWNGVKQLRIGKIRKQAVSDEVDMSDLVKAAPEAASDMYTYILEKANAIADEGLRAMAVAFLTENKERLLYYPAASRNHHAEFAGLLYHIKRMLAMGIRACEVYTNLDRDWVVCGVILHDMEKLNEIESNELGISPGYSFEGKMLGHIAQGIKAVDKLAEKVGLDREKAIMLEHMILSHHYEPDFGSPKKPLFPEAELLHYLDMLDAKMFDFQDALESVLPGNFSDHVRTLDGRQLYKPTFKE